MIMEYEVYWAKTAEEDLSAIIEYIHSDNPLTANDNLKKIEDKVSNLNSFPQRGRILPELKEYGILQYRELIVPPWRIIYRITELQVYVLSVVDSRRNIEDLLLDLLVRNK